MKNYLFLAPDRLIINNEHRRDIQPESLAAHCVACKDAICTPKCAGFCLLCDYFNVSGFDSYVDKFNGLQDINHRCLYLYVLCLYDFGFFSRVYISNTEAELAAMQSASAAVHFYSDYTFDDFCRSLAERESAITELNRAQKILKQLNGIIIKRINDNTSIVSEKSRRYANVLLLDYIAQSYGKAAESTNKSLAALKSDLQDFKLVFSSYKPRLIERISRLKLKELSADEKTALESYNEQALEKLIAASFKEAACYSMAQPAELISAGGDIIAAVSDHSLLTVINSSTAKPIKKRAHRRSVTFLKAYSDLLLSCDCDGVLKFWDHALRFICQCKLPALLIFALRNADVFYLFTADKNFYCYNIQTRGFSKADLKPSSVFDNFHGQLKSLDLPYINGGDSAAFHMPAPVQTGDFTLVHALASSFAAARSDGTILYKDDANQITKLCLTSTAIGCRILGTKKKILVTADVYGRVCLWLPETMELISANDLGYALRAFDATESAVIAADFDGNVKCYTFEGQDIRSRS